MAAIPKIKPYIPTPAQISRETITVIIGALIAAAILSQVPSVKAWIKAQFTDAGLNDPMAF